MIGSSNKLLQAASNVGGGGFVSDPWNITNMEYFYNDNYTNIAQGLFNNAYVSFWKPDGKTLFIAGYFIKLAEYQLTTAWDLSTASLVTSRSVSPSSCSALWFKPDGTSFYVTDSGDIIYQYNMSTAWDISSAPSSATNSFSIYSVETNTQSLIFKPDGTKFYAAGTSGNGSVHTFTMSTAWDISTSSFASTQTTGVPSNVRAFTLNYDGSSAYFVDSSEVLYERALSTAYDFSTLSSSNTSTVNLSSDSNNFYGIFLTEDETKVFLSNSLPNTLMKYQMSTAGDLSTATFTQPSYNWLGGINTYETEPNGLYVGNNGSELYICGDTGDDVTQYTLSTAYDLTTASYTRAFSVSSQVSNPNQLWFKSDGTVMFVQAITGAAYVYNLSTAWNISTASYSTNYDYSEAGRTDCFYFKPDGTKVFGVDGVNGDVYGYDLSTAWDLSNTSGPSPVNYLGLTGSGPSALFIDSSGTRLYVLDSNTDLVYQYSLSTAWDVSTGTFVRSKGGLGESVPQGMWFKSDGTKMYILGRIQDDVREFDLSTAWDISTASFGRDFSISGQEYNPYGLTFNAAGTKMYIEGSSSDTIFEYDLSTAWNVTTASYNNVSFNVNSYDGFPMQLVFGDSGSKLYFVGLSGDEVNEFDLSTAYDISTMSYNQTLSVRSVENKPYGIFFKSDGSKFYIVGQQNTKVLPFSMTTNWDISTATFDGFPTSNYLVLSTFSSSSSPYEGISFKSDGTKMFLMRSHYSNGAGSNYYNQIEEYSLSTAWDITTAPSSPTIRYIGAEITYGHNMFFRSDGTQLFVLNRSTSSTMPWLDFVMNYDV